MKSWVGALAFILVFSSCRPGWVEPNWHQKYGFYPQDFKTPVAALVQERNGQPFYMASAFLVDKESGTFATAKHFVENIGENGFVIFFNGRVYNGLVLATPAISDLALVDVGGFRVFDELPYFNSADFPEELSLSKDQLKVGEVVKVQGMHPHPSQWQTGKHLLGIFKDYYGLPWAKTEFVLDELEGKVSRLAVEIKNKDIAGAPKGARFISNIYIEIITDEDHLFSFGGLSGGPVTNQNGQVVGVLSHGFEGGYVEDGQVLAYQPWNTLRLVPVKELKRLLGRL